VREIKLGLLWQKPSALVEGKTFRSLDASDDRDDSESDNTTRHVVRILTASGLLALTVLSGLGAVFIQQTNSSHGSSAKAAD
jgi:hypothetical protein